MLDCIELAREYPALAGPCCDSCHDDANDWGYDLLEGHLTGGREYRVCCFVHHRLRDADMLADYPVQYRARWL